MMFSIPEPVSQISVIEHWIYTYKFVFGLECDSYSEFLRCRFWLGPATGAGSSPWRSESFRVLFPFSSPGLDCSSRFLSPCHKLSVINRRTYTHIFWLVIGWWVPVFWGWLLWIEIINIHDILLSKIYSHNSELDWWSIMSIDLGLASRPMLRIFSEKVEDGSLNIYSRTAFICRNG